MNKMKIFYTILTMMVFALGFSASDVDDLETKEQKEEREQFMKETIGAYEIIDEDEVTYTITINSDMTMTAEAKGNTYYGSWSRNINGLAVFKFSGDVQEYPRIRFKADKKNNASTPYICNEYFIANDGFLYGGSSSYVEAHDPDYRLKIRKIK